MKSYKNYYKIFFYVLIFFSFVSFVLFFFFRSEFSGYTHPTTTLTIFPLSSSTMPSATAVLPPPHPHRNPPNLIYCVKGSIKKIDLVLCLHQRRAKERKNDIFLHKKIVTLVLCLNRRLVTDV